MFSIIRLVDLFRFRAIAPLVAFGVLITVAVPVRADVFTVSDVNVDLTRDTAAKARQDALNLAHEEAFAFLMRRLTPQREHARLPTLTVEQILPMVSGLQIVRERSSAVRYIGQLVISFKPDAVREVLRANQLDFAETPSPTIAVLPVYEWAGVLSLWEKSNPWRAAWAFKGPATGLVPTVIPEGGLADVGALSAEQAAAGDRVRIGALAQRYQASGAVVALARYLVDARSGRPRLELRVQPHDGAPFSGFSDAITGQSGEEAKDLALRGVTRVMERLESDWKSRNIISASQVAESIVAVLPLNGLPDLVAARQRIAQVATVRQSELVSITT
ncbi:MAG: DUF2066 domain-containing protein, partial [Pirellulales bacterium]|nr:DUF2066 domain-containing protein [Pirellulales bacterium]